MQFIHHSKLFFQPLDTSFSISTTDIYCFSFFLRYCISQFRNRHFNKRKYYSIELKESYKNVFLIAFWTKDYDQIIKNLSPTVLNVFFMNSFENDGGEMWISLLSLNTLMTVVPAKSKSQVILNQKLRFPLPHVWRLYMQMVQKLRKMVKLVCSKKFRQVELS